jgi:hypothetical protein
LANGQRNGWGDDRPRKGLSVFAEQLDADIPDVAKRVGRVLGHDPGTIEAVFARGAGPHRPATRVEDG